MFDSPFWSSPLLHLPNRLPISRRCQIDCRVILHGAETATDPGLPPNFDGAHSWQKFVSPGSGSGLNNRGEPVCDTAAMPWIQCPPTNGCLAAAKVAGDGHWCALDRSKLTLPLEDDSVLAYGQEMLRVNAANLTDRPFFLAVGFHKVLSIPECHPWLGDYIVHCLPTMAPACLPACLTATRGGCDHRVASHTSPSTFPQSSETSTPRRTRSHRRSTHTPRRWGGRCVLFGGRFD
jgi:hypothetical protein